MISNNYQNQFSYGAVKDVVPQNINDKLPQNVQNFDVRETVGDNTAVKAAKNADTDPVTIGLTGALWIGMAQFCQFLNNKLDANWDKSWLGKIGAKAESFALKHTKNGSSKRVRNFINGLFDKSAVLRSLKTPTRPQNSFAISQARGITGYVMSDVSSMLGYHLKNGHGDDILNLVKDLKPDLKTGKEALDYIDGLFKNCEQNKIQINELVKKLSQSDIKVAVDNLVNSNIHIPFTKTSFNFKIPNVPFLKRKGSFKEMANKLNSVLSNSAGLGAEVTTLGKSLPRQALKTLEGLTNGGAGGKLLIVIQASIFAQAIKKAMDAPKGEKLSTFTENIANDFGFFLALPLQVKSSHIAGGLKYIGIGGAKDVAQQTKNVAKYREMIKALNEKVAAGTLSHIDYLKERNAIKTFLKGDSKWYHKPLKFIGKVFSTGLDEETIKPFINAADNSLGNAVFSKLRNLANKVKGPYVGTILRFAVGTMLVGPLISKAVTKISHLIFGRPSKSILDEDKKEETKTPQSANNPLNMTQEELMQKLASNPQLMQKMENDPKFLEQVLNDPELFKKLLNNEIKPSEVKAAPSDDVLNSKYIVKQGQTQNPAGAAYSPAPAVQNPAAINPISQPQSLNALDNSSSKANLFGLGKDEKQEQREAEDNAQNDPLEPVRTYIPSSECTIKNKNTNGALDPEINNALLKAQKVEEAALRQLNNL